MSNVILECAGRLLPNARDDIRRYCGLPWSGGEPETWAYEYFDSVPTGCDDVVGPPDLLASAVLHPGFGGAQMVLFDADRVESVRQWVAELPKDVDLGQADQQVLAHLASLPELAGGIGLSLLSKVVHHKRPKLVPLFDRSIVDWYRKVTGVRGQNAWPDLVRSLRSDLAGIANRETLAGIRAELGQELRGPVPSDLRLVDIAIWMDGRAS